jgi:drug/metabolite transporter (DMT)-like permease
MSGTKPWAILVVVLCTIFTSMGSLFMKLGADRISLSSLAGILEGYFILIGFLLYFIGFILLTLSFRHGELSILFPFVSLSFVWVAILSFIILSEPINMVEILGVVSIVLGVILIGAASRNKKGLRLKS